MLLSRPIEAALRCAARLAAFEVRGAPLRAVVAATGAMFAVCLVLSLKLVLFGSDGYRFGDFYALWSSARLAAEGAAASNYDADALHRYQVALGLHPDGYNPFPYPPTFLLILAPLGALSLAAAYVLFMSGTLALYLWALAGRRDAWPDWRALLGALIAPATCVTLMSGQSGFLTGGLMIGALRLTERRPILAGVLFGLLACKPQLGILAPVALLAAGRWRTILAASATAIAGMALSSLVFGLDIWPAWLASLTAYSGRYAPLATLMPTIAANARLLGAPAPLATAIQLCVSAAVAVVVWRAFRAGGSARAGALLLVGTFLATPHAFNYDMPMTTAAALWLLNDRLRATRSLSLLEIAGLASILILPVAMVIAGKHAPPISWAAELLIFCLIANARFGRAAITSRDDAASDDREFVTRPVRI